MSNRIPVARPVTVGPTDPHAETTSEGAHLAPVRRSWHPLVWLAALAYRSVAGRVGAPVRVIFAHATRRDRAPPARGDCRARPAS
jgi:hypothetical protein